MPCLPNFPNLTFFCICYSTENACPSERAPPKDPDPTVAAVAAYDMTAMEIIIGWFLLSLTPLMYLGRRGFLRELLKLRKF